MTLVEKILGAPVGGAIDAVGNVLDRLFTSDDERLTREEALARLAQTPQLAQIELNKIEAAHPSVFVAGWRPFIGWVCGVALAWHFVGYDFFVWFALAVGLPAPPILAGTEELISVVVSLLGLGVLRTVEKSRGIAK
jgi:hypothetical protein